MIIFRNDGVVPIAAFTTFGMSAKPGSTNPNGLSATEEVKIEMEVHAWARILKLLEDNEDAAAPGLREQLEEAGWKDVEKQSEDVEDEDEEPLVVAPVELEAIEDMPF
jgi:hypothetical protein